MELHNPSLVWKSINAFVDRDSITPGTMMRVLLLFACAIAYIQAAPLGLKCNTTTTLTAADSIAAQYTVVPNQNCLYSIVFPIGYAALLTVQGTNLYNGEQIRVFNDQLSQSSGNFSDPRQATNFTSVSLWPANKVYIETITSLFADYSMHVTLGLKALQNTQMLSVNATVIDGQQPTVFNTSYMKTDVAYVFTSLTRVTLTALSALQTQTIPGNDLYGMMPSRLYIYDGPSTQSKLMGSLDSYRTSPFISSGNSMTLYYFPAMGANYQDEWISIGDYSAVNNLTSIVYAEATSVRKSVTLDATKGPATLTIMATIMPLMLHDISFSATTSEMKLFNTRPSNDMSSFLMFGYRADSGLSMFPQYIPLDTVTLLLDSGVANISFIQGGDERTPFKVNSSGYNFSGKYGKLANQHVTISNYDLTDELSNSNTSITFSIDNSQFQSPEAYIHVLCGENPDIGFNYTQPLPSNVTCNTNFMVFKWWDGSAPTMGQIVRFQIGTHVPKNGAFFNQGFTSLLVLLLFYISY